MKSKKLKKVKNRKKSNFSISLILSHILIKTMIWQIKHVLYHFYRFLGKMVIFQKMSKMSIFWPLEKGENFWISGQPVMTLWSNRADSVKYQLRGLMSGGVHFFKYRFTILVFELGPPQFLDNNGKKPDPDNGGKLFFVFIGYRLQHIVNWNS